MDQQENRPLDSEEAPGGSTDAGESADASDGSNVEPADVARGPLVTEMGDPQGCAASLSSKTDVKLESISQSMAGLGEMIQSIAFQLEQNQRREDLIDKLHSENQAYKNDVFKRMLMPIVNEVIFLIDAYTQLFRSYQSKDLSEIDSKKLLKQFGEVPEDLENALYKNGVDAYASNEGVTVDLARQKVLKTVPTDDPSKDKTVCASVKKGFVFEGKVIRQEQVTCYKCANNPSAERE